MATDKHIIRVFHYTPERVKELQEKYPDAEIQAHYCPWHGEWVLREGEVWKPSAEYIDTTTILDKENEEQ